MTVYITTPFAQGEVPLASLTYQYQDSDGVVLDDIDDTWDVVLRIQRRGADPEEREAAIKDAGTAVYDWQDGDLDDAGIYRGQFEATDGTNTVKSQRIVWYVESSVPAATGS